ncbi:hypothetical protein ASE03_27635 [Kitasatospora sp. Root187]|uniref:toxin glutamine deamidase domain-containing protein n=2 Tax=unclassified Kitasatospora TaxID=2633591 RepID=UPI00070CF334|nr:toxin glutamine deamidase domain-containing protein [Kitasatospora sp. Root187]KRB69219.1 hypothetical protein ASE03_27635 [Kitasatospora sp. Root187]
MSAAGGAIGGAAGGVIGKGLGAAGGKLIGKKMDTLPAQMVEGALTDVGADVVTQLALTGEVDGSGLGGSALSGAGSPAIMRGASALKGKFNSSDIPDASDFAGGTDTPGSGSSNSSDSSGSSTGSSSSSSNGSANPGPGSGGDADPETRIRRPDPASNGADQSSHGGDADPETRVRRPDPASNGADTPPRFSGGDADPETRVRTPAGDSSDRSVPRSAPDRSDSPPTFATSRSAGHDVTPTIDSSPYQGPTAGHSDTSTPRGTIAPFEAPTSRTPDAAPSPIWGDNTNSRSSEPTSTPTPEHGRDTTSHSETSAPRAEPPAPRPEATAPTPHQSASTPDTRSVLHEGSGTPVSSGPPTVGGAPGTSGAPQLDGIRLASGPAVTRGPSPEGTAGAPDVLSAAPVRGADSPPPAASNPGGGTVPPMTSAGPFSSGPVHSGESRQARPASPGSAAGKPARSSSPTSDPGAGSLRLGPARPSAERNGTRTETAAGTGGKRTPDQAALTPDTPRHAEDTVPAPRPEPHRPATDGRPLGGDGGLAEPTSRDHERIEHAVPRNEDGTPQRHPDPNEGDWHAAINGDGPGTPGRNNNCVDTTLALLDTFHGNPTPAAARTPDLDANGNPSDLGERDGRDRIERNLGAQFSDLGDGPAAFQRLEETLHRTGHGSAAAIITTDADGRSHSWTAVNHNGTITYVDGQTGKRSNQPLHNGDTGVFAIPLTPDRNPATPVPHADPDHNPANDRRAPERPSAETPPPPPKTPDDGKAEGGDVPSPPHQDGTEVDFPPPGPRVAVAGDGLCLLNSLAVSAPGLVGPQTTNPGDAARRLQSAVENHFSQLPPEQWPTEVVANYRNHLLLPTNLTAGQLLNHLPVDVREGYAGLPLADLRQIVGDHLSQNAPPPSAREREALLRTVRDWNNRWLTSEGEMLPAAAAHALGLRLRVLGHDGVPRALFGPPDGQPVTVYHQGNHYDGSEPVTTAPPTAQAPAATPAAPKNPVPEKAAEKPATLKEPVPEPKLEPEAEPKPESEPKLETEPEAEPKPKDTPGSRPIAGTDLVVGLTGNEAAVREKVIDVLERAVPGDRAAARAFADAHFGPATLRPMLSALSRGEVWTAPLDGNGWSGSVKLRGQVTESTHLRTEKIEFENGADRTVALGTGRDAQWQYNIGVQARQSGAGAEAAELAGYFHDRGQGEVNLDLGGMVARSKTSEPADIFGTTMRLELDFGDLRHDHQPVTTDSGKRTETVDLSLNVAVPVRPDGDSVGEPRTPPRRLQEGRVGGQEIVLDLSPRGGSKDQPPVEALLDQVKQAAEQEFGKDWPAMREKVLAEVDFARLQRDLKSMTAGEPATVTLTDRRGKTLGTVEISARVGDLRQTGTTKETEFNIGTTVQQVRSSATNRGNAGQFGLAGVLRPGAALFGAGGAGRLGRDRIEITGDSRTSQLTSKSKVPGVRYEGAVHFDMKFNGKAATHEAGTADVQLLVDRADTAPETVKPEPAPNADETAALPVPEVTGPPDSVWQGGDDRGGLGETVVVRDLESTAALRAAVDAKGREQFGKDWDTVREQVLRGFSQPNLAAKLTGMTRGEPLEVKIPGKENLVVTAVARVESMTYRREDGKAELNTVNETGAFSVNRQLLARTVAANGQFGGTVAKATPGAPGADLFANVNGQQRERAGGQGRQADRVYANGKYSAPQVIFGAELAVDVHFGPPGRTTDGQSGTTAQLRVEVGMDARDTVKVPAPGGKDAAITFKQSAEPAVGTSPDDQSDPAGRKAVEVDRPEATHTAPSRMREQHELNASYVVHSLSGADKVRSTVEDAVRAKYGEPSEEVKQKLDATFDRVALKTQLSQLTRGGKITETVSGTTWKAEVTVTARLADATYHSTAGKYEFESGTRTSRGQGNLRDSRERLDGGGLLRMKAPFVDVAGGYTYRMDRTYGHGSETVGSASNRGKHVEPAVFFDVDTAYDVQVSFERLGVDDGSHSQQVDTVARVAVPMRDADPVPTPGSAPVERTTTKQPKGFVEGRRLDSSAIVTDVHALPGPARSTPTAGPRKTLGESVLSQVESGWKPSSLLPSVGKSDGKPKLESNPFGSDWDGIHRKLDAELTPDRLQSRLKGMTAGDEIVVRHGRTTVRVGAVLRDRMEHLGDSGTTEFNTGTDVQRSFADTDATGHGHQGLLGVTTAVPVAGTPVSVTAGVTGTGGRGQDHADVRNTSTSAGSATKAKLPGSAYRGEAELQFTITRRPLVGASVHQRRTAAIGFETIVESGETVPVVPKRSDDAAAPVQPPRTLPAEAPAKADVRIPPERVWEDGLRDTDVLRFLGDVGGVQDLVRLRGPEFFGKSTWQDMEPVVGTVTSHSHLSALFGTASQGTEVSATVPTNRVTLGGGKGVEVGVKIVSLEHRDTDTAVESSPSNSTSSGTVRSDLAAKNAGVQGQVGARITGDVTNNPAITGGAQRFWREGGTQSDAGQIISNGKYPTPMARYSGAAEVEVTLFDGKRNPVKEKGIVPFTVDIPLSETTGVDLPGDHYLAFTEDSKGGELRSEEGARLLDDVHRTLSQGDQPFDHTTATPAELEQLTGTVRVGRTAFGGEFTAGTEAGDAHIRATHRLVELSGGSSAATSALLGDLLGTPDGAPLKAEEVRQVIDYVERKATQGPVTLDDLVAGAQDGWPAHEPYEIDRQAWTDDGPANELVTAAMAEAAATTRLLLQDGQPTFGRLYLTVSGEGAELPLRREFELSDDPEQQIRTIEEATYLKPGTRPSEVGVRLGGASEAGRDWDFRITARAEGSRELMLRVRRPSEE